MADVLLEEVSPFGNLLASVEVDNHACYFYLGGLEDSDFEIKAVWVRNLAPAPETLDLAGMQEGVPPLNPIGYARHNGAMSALIVEDIRIVWLPEGNGAALYERDHIIAILPPWAGTGGCSGYSVEAAANGPLAWELPPDSPLLERFAAADLFWASWNEDTWTAVRDRLVARMEAGLGVHTNYYNIDGGEWPPKAMLRIPCIDSTALVTIGVSILPQPSVEMDRPDPDMARRIELGTLLPSTWRDEDINRFGRYMSGQTGYPWRHHTWLGRGHTIPCDSWRNPRFTFALLLDFHPAAQWFDLGPQDGDPVTLLWFLPITSEEQAFAEAHSSDELLGRLPPDRWQDT